MMHRFAKLAVWSVCAVSAQGASGLDPTVLNLLRPDAGFVLGLDVRRLVAPPFGDLLRKQIQEAGLSAIPGMDAVQKTILEDIDAVVLAASMKGLTTGAQPSVLIVVKGRFTRDQVRELIQGKKTMVETYRGVELLATPEKVRSVQMRVALLDAGTVVIGEGKELRAAIDRHGAAPVTPASGSLAARAAALSSRFDIWAVGDIPAGEFKTAAAGVPHFDSVKGVELGVSSSHGLDMEVNLRTKSAEAAASLTPTVEAMLAMAKMSLEKSPETAKAPEVLEIFNKIKVAPEMAVVRISLSLNPAELERTVQFARVTRQAPRPVQHVNSKPNTIRITGLDQGPVEIPVQPAR